MSISLHRPSKIGGCFGSSPTGVDQTTINVFDGNPVIKKTSSLTPRRRSDVNSWLFLLISRRSWTDTPVRQDKPMRVSSWTTQCTVEWPPHAIWNTAHLPQKDECEPRGFDGQSLVLRRLLPAIVFLNNKCCWSSSLLSVFVDDWAIRSSVRINSLCSQSMTAVDRLVRSLIACWTADLVAISEAKFLAAIVVANWPPISWARRWTSSLAIHESMAPVSLNVHEC